jgi:hypothetical protein
MSLKMMIYLHAVYISLDLIILSTALFFLSNLGLHKETMSQVLMGSEGPFQSLVQEEIIDVSSQSRHNRIINRASSHAPHNRNRNVPQLLLHNEVQEALTQYDYVEDTISNSGYDYLENVTSNSGYVDLEDAPSNSGYVDLEDAPSNSGYVDLEDAPSNPIPLQIKK